MKPLYKKLKDALQTGNYGSYKGSINDEELELMQLRHEMWLNIAYLDLLNHIKKDPNVLG